MDQIADNTLWIAHLAAGEFASLSRGAQAPDSLEKIFIDSMDHIQGLTGSRYPTRPEL